MYSRERILQFIVQGKKNENGIVLFETVKILQ